MKRIGNDTTKTVRTEEDLDILGDKGLSQVDNPKIFVENSFRVVDITPPSYIHVHIRGYVYYYGGYAEHTRHVVDGLNKRNGYCLKLSPINSPINIDPIALSRMNSFMKAPGFDIGRSIFLCIASPGWMRDDRFLPDSRYSCGWTMVETLDVNPEIKGWLENLNELWVPTQTDMRRFSGHPNMHLMRLGYDTHKFNENVKPVDIVNLRNRYVFGFVGSWNKRKGVKEIVQAFCRAFSVKDPVSLLFFTRYGTRPYDEMQGFCGAEPRKAKDLKKWTINWELRQILEEIGGKNLPHITVLDVPLHENVLPNLMQRFDCLVGFSRGESTWLPGLHGMALGLPVVQLASDASGFMDYLEDVGWMCTKVSYEESTEEDYKGTSTYYAGEKLATGDVDELTEMLQRIYRETTRAVHNVIQRTSKGVSRVKEWTWWRSIDKIDRRLKILGGQI
jgi:glycosyltransferase involved in cell wall biosynthesis